MIINKEGVIAARAQPRHVIAGTRLLSGAYRLLSEVETTEAEVTVPVIATTRLQSEVKACRLLSGAETTGAETTQLQQSQFKQKRNN